MSFGGKSYAHYSLTNPMDRRLTLALMMRTVQTTGNIMYSAGARDYSILEVSNGCIQYRFDCGSGEGLVRVETSRVSDGAWHEVVLERRANVARVLVDRRHESSGAAPGVHDILNLDANDLFFGAEVRQGYDELRSGFVGCLDDVRVDGVSLPLHVSGGSPAATLRRLANVRFACQGLFDPSVCGGKPCLNGGTCQPKPEPNAREYSCSCLPRFQGPNCEVDTDPCASAPCLHGGTCRNDAGRFVCSCTGGLSGARCDYGRHCNPNPCLNEGLCEEGPRSHLCRCRGFSGPRCELDVDECLHLPCALGASCVNLPGSFRCICPTNATGPLCSETTRRHHWESSLFLPTPLLEIVAVAAGLVVLCALAAVVACCWKRRRKTRPPGTHSCGAHPLERGVGSEMTVKNCMLAGTKDNVKRMSKVSNLEQQQTSLATPPLPPRPASYTPSMQDTALNNFDTVRSYGSAADDLESRYQANDLRANNHLRTNLAKGPKPLPQSNSASDTVSPHKAAWDVDKDRIYLDKIPNDLKAAKVMLPPMSLLNKHASALPCKSPPSLGVSSATSLTSEDLPGYTWDYSDLTTEQKPLANIAEVSGNEVQDSSSLQSADSNSQNSQMDLLPSLKGSELLTASDYVGDSESEFLDGHAPFQGYEQLLQISEDDEDTGDPSSPHRYERHPNQYLPSHCLSNDPSPGDNLSDDGVVSYGFPTQGGRGFLVGTTAPVTPHLSCSDLSVGNVCDIEDSEEDDDTDNTVVRKPLATSTTMV